MKKRIALAWASLCLLSISTAASASDIYHVDLPADFVSEIETIFNVNQDGTAFNLDLVSGENPNLHLFQEAAIHVTFIHEAAGYKNQFGYFTYQDVNDDGLISDEEILDEVLIFPNVSEEGDVLNTGDTVNIGPFPAGTNIGFFIVANGYVDPKGVYYSLSELNEDGAQHFPMIATSDGGNIAIGIEDLPWESSDKDCNDVIFTFTTTPEDAIVEVIEENQIPVNETPEEEAPEEQPSEQEKVCFCHNLTHNPHTICTANEALINAHMDHVNGEVPGVEDALGECGPEELPPAEQNPGEEEETPAVEQPGDDPADETEKPSDDGQPEDDEANPEETPEDSFEPTHVPGEDFIVKDGDIDENTPLDPATGPLATAWYLEGTGMGCSLSASGGESSIHWVFTAALAALPILSRRHQ